MSLLNVKKSTVIVELPLLSVIFKNSKCQMSLLKVKYWGEKLTSNVNVKFMNEYNEISNLVPPNIFETTEI